MLLKLRHVNARDFTLQGCGLIWNSIIGSTKTAGCILYGFAAYDLGLQICILFHNGGIKSSEGKKVLLLTTTSLVYDWNQVLVSRTETHVHFWWWFQSQNFSYPKPIMVLAEIIGQFGFWFPYYYVPGGQTWAKKLPELLVWIFILS